MSMISWAEREVEFACKKENPDRKEGVFGYGYACYESALKAFKSLMEDGHSVASIDFTKEILNRLIEHKPLTEIEDVKDDWDFLTRIPNNYDEYRSNRMGSLFKEVYPDGTIKYHDVNRVQCVDQNDCMYYNGFVSRIIHDLYPIKMPYFPESPYVVFVEEYLYDPDNGDFDTLRLIKVQLPDGTVHELNKYYKQEGYTFVEIDVDEYTARMGDVTGELINNEPDAANEGDFEFKIGDTVKVVTGRYMGLMGIIDDIYGKIDPITSCERNAYEINFGGSDLFKAILSPEYITRIDDEQSSHERYSIIS